MTCPDGDRRRGALHSGDRCLVAVCLLVSAGAHLPLVPAHLREARYVGVAFIVLAASCLVLAVALALRDTVAAWAAVAALDLLALTAYVVTRTVGLPLLSDDVGNWLEPLSFPALAAELVSLVVAASVLAGDAATTLVVVARGRRRARGHLRDGESARPRVRSLRRVRGGLPDQDRCARQCAGGWPRSRLNARLNASSDW